MPWGYTFLRSSIWVPGSHMAVYIPMYISELTILTTLLTILTTLLTILTILTSVLTILSTVSEVLSTVSEVLSTVSEVQSAAARSSDEERVPGAACLRDPWGYLSGDYMVCHGYTHGLGPGNTHPLYPGVLPHYPGYTSPHRSPVLYTAGTAPRADLNA